MVKGEVAELLLLLFERCSADRPPRVLTPLVVASRRSVTKSSAQSLGW